MKFKPVNLEEMGSSLWEVGAYKFKVENATEVTGNYGAQLELVLMLKDSKGNTKSMKTWINPDSPSLGFFSRSVGLLERYNTGELFDGDCMDKVGFCELTHVEKDGKTFNRVSKYLTQSEFDTYSAPVKSAVKETVKTAPVAEFLEDSIPF